MIPFHCMLFILHCDARRRVILDLLSKGLRLASSIIRLHNATHADILFVCSAQMR